jgi:two-component system NtrC family sensor kinase
MVFLPPEQSTILAVDDNPANLGLLSDFLYGAGFEVLTARSGEIAIARAQRTLPDLILLDVMMPEMDGFEVCKKLKEDPTTAAIPVIFMTALADVSNKSKGFELGAVDYITKPFHQEEVLVRIQLHLRLYHLTRQVKSQNEVLEQRVQERTQALESALKALRATQVQLIQGEKMSSLGKLVSGIAHEINNPVNFIYGNLIHIQDYVDHLLSGLSLYQTVAPPLTASQVQQLEDLDLEFIQEDLPKLVQSMQVGADRIRQIVLGLRNFARTDESQIKDVNLNDGLDSTLMLLQSRLKSSSKRPEISVIKQYGELLLFGVYPGPLNQVWMNLLGNAIDALEDWSEAQPGAALTIEIQTRMTSTGVEVAIADNGPGIPPAVQAQMFDPFFTTKPVERGTGLGLSISQQIVSDLHRGTLTYQGVMPHGSRFTIHLPKLEEMAGD